MMSKLQPMWKIKLSLSLILFIISSIPMLSIHAATLPQNQAVSDLWLDISIGPLLVDWFNQVARPHDIARIERVQQLELLDGITAGRKLVIFKSIAEAERFVPLIAHKIDIIGYNFEHGQITPLEEKDDPVQSIKQMRDLADRYDLKLALGPDHRFALSHGVVMSPYVDLFILQVQRVQTEPDTVLDFVLPLIPYLRQANPNLEISVQVRTEGNVVDIGDLIDSIKAELDGVSILTSPETVSIAFDLVDELQSRTSITELPTVTPIIPTATASQSTDSQSTDLQSTDSQATDLQATDSQATDLQATDSQPVDLQLADSQLVDLQQPVGSVSSLWLDVSMGPPLVDWFNQVARPHDIARIERVEEMEMLDKVTVGRKLVVFKSIAEAERFMPQIAAKIDIIGYNFEHEQLTPPDEKANPVQSIKRMRDLARQYDLLLALGPDHDFALSHGVAMAPYVDLFVLQVQRVQTKPDMVFDFVQPLAPQLRQANPNLEISVQVRTEGDVVVIGDLLGSIKDNLDGVSILTSPETVGIAFDLVAELQSRTSTTFVPRVTKPAPSSQAQLEPFTIQDINPIWLLIIGATLLAGIIIGGLTVALIVSYRK